MEPTTGSFGPCHTGQTARAVHVAGPPHGPHFILCPVVFWGLGRPGILLGQQRTGAALPEEAALWCGGTCPDGGNGSSSG
eukprot:1026792-Pelagomonas_calceolata.AAC.1